MDDKLVPFPLACCRLGMAPQTGYNRVNLKTFPIPVVKRGTRSYVRASDLEAAISGTSVKGQAPEPAKRRVGRPRAHLTV